MKYIFLTMLALLLPLPALASTTLAVPFTSQAPTANWAQPWRDACEEASIFMVHRYYGEKGITKSDAVSGILSIFTMKHALYGTSLDEPLSTLEDIINYYLPWSAHVVENPTLDMLQAELNAGRPVIVPFYAPALHNSHFRGTFSYHMAVLSGYDDEKKEFIVEEPGTQFGADYRYSYETVLSAMHDFAPGDISTSPQRALFTSPTIGDTGSFDADHDGLTKTQEFAHGTIPYFADSDGDGFTDGDEVARGFLPTRNEQLLVRQGALLVAPGSPRVYYIDKGQKRHIPNEIAFHAHGWEWSMLDWISDAMMDTIPEGTPLTY